VRRVLIATDDRTFSVALCDAYRARGYEVDLGVSALWLDLKHYDIIHLHWPEELVGWAMPPRADAVDRLIARLTELRTRSTLIATVHNLLPHSAPRYHDGAGDLYAQIYAQMDRIGHFSGESVAQVCALFPAIPADRHVLHGMNDFRDLMRHAVGRDAARAALGFQGDEIVIGLFGSLRNPAEASLAYRAIDQLSLKNAKILFAARPPFLSGRFSRKLAQLRFARWLRRNPVQHHKGFIDDHKMVTMFEAMDMLLIARCDGHLNSGQLPLAMTFGTPLIAPHFGVFAEMIGTSDNILYTPGDASSAARAIERLATKPLPDVRRSNRVLAGKWGWETALGRLLAGIDEGQS
jgi:glycosyltransferase involved in cell wall biosynthesis